MADDKKHPNDYPRIQFQIIKREMKARLEERKQNTDSSINQVARRDLERYNTLVDAVRPTFAENEARLLLDVFNDKRFEPIETTLRLLWASLDDAEDIYYQKHGVEKEAFVSRIHDLSEAEALATIDAIERFWNHSNRATPQSVGLCETD
jgi:hypothetical protein